MSTLFDQISFNQLATPTAPLFQLATYSGTLSGIFDNVVGLPSGYFLDYSIAGEIDLTMTAVPEPSTWVAGFLAFGVLAFSQRRRLGALVTTKAKAALSSTN